MLTLRAVTVMKKPSRPRGGTMVPASRLPITTLSRQAALLSALSQPTHRAPIAPWRIAAA
jgi:hypothetical protein